MIRIRFDECISWRTVDALRALRLPEDIELESSHERAEEGAQDVSWIEEFAAREGKCFISGDTNMRRVILERAALQASGLIAIFPSSKKFFDGLRKYGQTAYLIRWFPIIERLARESEAGKHFQLPPSFSADFEHVIELSQLGQAEADGG